MGDEPIVFDTPPRKANRPKGTLVPMEFLTTPEGIVIRQSHDVTAMLDRNAELRWSDDRNGYTRDRTFKHVAEIDVLTYYKWLKDYGVDACNPDSWEFVKRQLNDSANLGLRTSKGRI